MQVAAGASSRDIHRIVSIWKRGRIHQREDGHTGKGSRKTIVRQCVIIRKPKVHCIRLIHDGRDGLIKKAIGTRRAHLRREASRVGHV